MKKISYNELANLIGGYSYSSCAEVQYAAGTHKIPDDPNPQEEEFEEEFWEDWYNEFMRLCK